MHRTCWIVKKKKSKTKLSFLLHLSASAVSRYSKQFQFSYSLFCSCQYYQQEGDAEARNVYIYIYTWILKDFLFVSLFLYRHFFIRPTNSNTLGFFYITYYSANNTSLNKRRSAMHIKKEILILYIYIYVVNRF